MDNLVQHSSYYLLLTKPDVVELEELFSSGFVLVTQSLLYYGRIIIIYTIVG